jgi:hypothetical protein
MIGRSSGVQGAYTTIAAAALMLAARWIAVPRGGANLTPENRAR